MDIMTPDKQAKSLDYLANQIKNRLNLLTQSVETTLEHARYCGELLSEAKQECKHGQWLNFLKEQCGISRWTATRYMHINQKWELIQKQLKESDSEWTIKNALDIINVESHQEINEVHKTAVEIATEALNKAAFAGVELTRVAANADVLAEALISGNVHVSGEAVPAGSLISLNMIEAEHESQQRQKQHIQDNTKNKLSFQKLLKNPKVYGGVTVFTKQAHHAVEIRYEPKGVWSSGQWLVQLKYKNPEAVPENFEAFRTEHEALQKVFQLLGLKVEADPVALPRIDVSEG